MVFKYACVWNTIYKSTFIPRLNTSFTKVSYSFSAASITNEVSQQLSLIRKMWDIHSQGVTVLKGAFSCLQYRPGWTKRQNIPTNIRMWTCMDTHYPHIVWKWSKLEKLLTENWDSNAQCRNNHPEKQQACQANNSCYLCTRNTGIYPQFLRTQTHNM